MGSGGGGGGEKERGTTVCLYGGGREGGSDSPSYDKAKLSGFRARDAFPLWTPLLQLQPRAVYYILIYLNVYV